MVDTRHRSIPAGPSDAVASSSSSTHTRQLLGAHSFQKRSPQPHAPSVHPSLLPSLLLACLALVLFLAFQAPSLPHDHAQLLLVYAQPVLPSLLMLWLFAKNVVWFDRLQINFRACFSPKEAALIPDGKQLLVLSAAVTLLALMCAAGIVVTTGVGLLNLSLRAPLLGYASIFLVVAAPHPLPGHRWRKFFLTTLARVLLPLHTVTFSDFLLADVLTSLSKPLSDLHQAICVSLTPQFSAMTKLQLHAFLGDIAADEVDPSGAPPSPSPPPSSAQDLTSVLCGHASPILPLCLALPYLIRLVQCLRIYGSTDTSSGDRTQLYNALKYCTALPVIVLSFLKYRVSAVQWEGQIKLWWIAAAVLNSAFSLYWDVEKDWGFPLLTRPSTIPRVLSHAQLPNGQGPLAFKSRLFYRWVILSNALLRGTWVFKTSSHLRHKQLLMLLFACLEVLRRHQWVYIRLEYELRKLASLPQWYADDSSNGNTSIRRPLLGGGGAGAGRASVSIDDED